MDALGLLKRIRARIWRVCLRELNEDNQKPCSVLPGHLWQAKCSVRSSLSAERGPVISLERNNEPVLENNGHSRVWMFHSSHSTVVLNIPNLSMTHPMVLGPVEPLWLFLPMSQ